MIDEVRKKEKRAQRREKGYIQCERVDEWSRVWLFCFHLNTFSSLVFMASKRSSAVSSLSRVLRY